MRLLTHVAGGDGIDSYQLVHKRHMIFLDKEAKEQDWHIQVVAPCGIRDYDGFWPGSCDKVFADALKEAVNGAKIGKQKDNNEQ